MIWMTVLADLVALVDLVLADLLAVELTCLAVLDPAAVLHMHLPQRNVESGQEKALGLPVLGFGLGRLASPL
ncbi:hypothetical protein [Streptomyces sp. c-19]|uniref:hypothetical protein n=1 Tax=Streptomyces sp. c-19 TaxID=2789275 RepID=UPI003980D4F5